jgi:hypothetical protein
MSDSTDPSHSVSSQTVTTVETESDDSPAPGMANERSVIAIMVVATFCLLELFAFIAWYLRPGATAPGVSSEFTMVVVAVIGFLFGHNVGKNSK